MNLTPQQRLLVYKTLLKVVCEDPRVDLGMCQYLSSLLNDSRKMPSRWWHFSGSDKMEMLPELNKYQPPHTYLFWAPITTKGWETRIGWIEQAIIDVKKKIK